MDNRAIANVFDEIADMLEIKGADFFRVNAYRRAALNISNMPKDLRDLVDKDPHGLPKLSGIGKALAQKIVELIQTGHCREHEKLKKQFPEGLLDLLHVRTLGPKKVKLLYEKLKVHDIADLKKACEAGKVQELAGMGEKSEKEILKAIEEHSKFSSDRHLLSEALHEASRIIDYMKNTKEIQQIEYAGSLRRMQSTVGDIDILVTVKNPKKDHEAVMKHFVTYEEVISVIAHGDTKSSVLINGGVQIDLRVVDEDCFGAALHYFTGDKQHNIAIRDLAKKKGLKVNEYGVFKGKKLIAGKKEEEVFKAVGLPYIIPEIRRDEGEIEYGLKEKKFPKFVERKDIKGDLHSHSTYSDAKNSIEEMAYKYIELGYEYFAISDHSSLVGVTNGMGSKDIKRQWKEVDRLNKKLKGKIHIFKGCEVDILKDGGMDFGDEILKELDIVIASAHLYHRLDSKVQTKRMIAAVENPYVNILGHPSGRLINKRPPMEFNMEKVIDACVQNRVALEINSGPSRLDLEDRYVRMAKDKGAKFAVNTDSHSINQTENIVFGLAVARRGWLTKADIVNCKSLKQFDTSF